MENTEAAKIAFFSAFNKCQGALDPVKTDSKNDHFGNRYPSLAAVMDAVKPFMEAGFSFIHEGVEINGKSYLSTSLFYNGYARTSLWPLVDDGNPQHLASSATYAKRYSISGLTGLVIDLDDDGNAAAASVPIGKKATPASPAPSTPSEVNIAKFIPGKIITKSVRKKDGTVGTAFEIHSPEGAVYSTFSETSAQISSHAKDNAKEVVIGFKQVGRFLNIVKLALNEAPKVEEEVPF